MRAFPPIVALTGASSQLRGLVARAIAHRFPELEVRSFKHVIEAAYAEANNSYPVRSSKERLKAFSQQQRDSFEDIWIHRVFTPPLAHGKTGALITDCKFLREFEALTYYQAFLIVVAPSSNDVSNDDLNNTVYLPDNWALRLALSDNAEAFDDLMESAVLPTIQHYLNN